MRQGLKNIVECLKLAPRLRKSRHRFLLLYILALNGYMVFRIAMNLWAGCRWGYLIEAVFLGVLITMSWQFYQIVLVDEGIHPRVKRKSPIETSAARK